MKTTLRLLAVATACGLSLSSCVVDPYGYPVAGGFAAPAYSSVNYYDASPLGYGGYGCAPASTSLSIFSGWGGGWGNGWGNNCNYGYNRPFYSSYSGGHRHYGSSRYSSPSHNYASQVTRPSTFRGSSFLGNPPAIPSVSPRSLPRSSGFHSSPAPSPSRSFSTPSLPRPSGRADRPSPLASFSAPSMSRSAPTISRSMPSAPPAVSRSFSAPVASSSSFSAPAGAPSSQRRVR